MTSFGDKMIFNDNSNGSSFFINSIFICGILGLFLAFTSAKEVKKEIEKNKPEELSSFMKYHSIGSQLYSSTIEGLKKNKVGDYIVYYGFFEDNDDTYYKIYSKNTKIVKVVREFLYKYEGGKSAELYACKYGILNLKNYHESRFKDLHFNNNIAYYRNEKLTLTCKTEHDFGSNIVSFVSIYEKI